MLVETQDDVIANVTAGTTLIHVLYLTPVIAGVDYTRAVARRERNRRQHRNVFLAAVGAIDHCAAATPVGAPPAPNEAVPTPCENGRGLAAADRFGRPVCNCTAPFKGRGFSAALPTPPGVPALHRV